MPVSATVRGNHLEGTWNMTTGDSGTWAWGAGRYQILGCPKEYFGSLCLLVQQHVWDRENALGFGLMGVRPE